MPKAGIIIAIGTWVFIISKPLSTKFLWSIEYK